MIDVESMLRPLASIDGPAPQDPSAAAPRSVPRGLPTGIHRRGPCPAWLLAGCLMAAGCSTPIPTDAPRLPSLDAAALAGSWHVVATNFPMWLSGDKQDPMFTYTYTYTPQTEQGTLRLGDVVSYRADGKRQTIVGVDTQDAVLRSQFVWRGRGWLSAFSSTWAVVAGAPEQGWLILFFTQTLATPAGVDIISRTPVLAPDAQALALRSIAASPFLRDRAQGLTWLPTPQPAIP